MTNKQLFTNLFVLILTESILAWHAVTATHTLHENIVACVEHRAKNILESQFTASQLRIAELLAEDIKQHLRYDYNIKPNSVWKHNFYSSYINPTSSYTLFMTDGAGICTDFTRVYTTMLNAVLIDAYQIDRVKLKNGSEHSYVIATLDGITYQIDITSYCTAAAHNADTSFSKYIKEVRLQ